MPARSDKLLRLNDDAAQYTLPYISKSRVMSWQKNPEHFRLKYLEGVTEATTAPMVRGTRIHETFEHLYETWAGLDSFRGPVPELHDHLPSERHLWASFIEPYVTNFAMFENRRWIAAGENPAAYMPVAVEDEVWRDPILGLDGEPEWMGIADVVVPAASIDEVDADEGVVVIDFKTGKVPKEQYRDKGIYMELEYYSIVFENEYDVVGAAAYYPKTDTLLVKPDDPTLEQKVLSAARSMVTACHDYEGDAKFEAKEGPLCKWGLDDDQESSFYGICSQCSWGKPAKNPETFKQYIEDGWQNWEIAQAMGCTENAVGYWKRKMNL